jgi:hypothetical protein
MLALFFGRDDLRFADTSESGRRRSFAGFAQAADEAGRSRIYGGIHFEFDNRTGLESGRAVARYVFRHSMQPRSTTAIVTREAYRPTPLTAAGTTTILDDSGWRPATYLTSAPVSVVAYYPGNVGFSNVASFSPIVGSSIFATSPVVSPLGSVLLCEPANAVDRTVVPLPEPAITYSFFLP